MFDASQPDDVPTVKQEDDGFDLSIGADGLDIEHFMAVIRDNVARKTAEGAYRDLRIAQAERHNLQNLRDDEKFLRFYLECLHEAACVDINDFEIHERRRLGGGLLVALKKIIWQLLKFYTYRLWSQQNQVNGLLVTAVESLDEKYRARLTALESRLDALQSDAGGGQGKCPPPGT